MIEKLENHNPGNRHIPAKATVTPISATNLPSHLGPEGTAMAQYIIDYAALWLCDADMPTVTALAEVVDLEAQMTAQMAQDSLLRPNGNGIESVHPLMKPLLELKKHKLDLLKALGLTPKERRALAAIEVDSKVKVSKLDAFLMD